MKKILAYCLLFICIFLVSCDNPEKNYNKAMEKFNNKAYTEAETLLSKLIEKYPSSEFAEKSKEKTAEIYWIRAMEKFNNKDYIETKNILNGIIEKYPGSYFAKESEQALKRFKAQDVIDAIKNNKNSIEDGTTTMLQVVIDTIGEPTKTFDDETYNILLYGEEAKDAKEENLNSVSFVIKVPILGAKTIKSMSTAFENGKKINKGIGKVICAELNAIEKETREEINNAIYNYSSYGGGYASGYQIGQQIGVKMAAKMDKAISCEHIFNIQFEKLQIWFFDERIV